MIGAKHLFYDTQGTPLEWFGLLILALVLVEQCSKSVAVENYSLCLGLAHLCNVEEMERLTSTPTKRVGLVVLSHSALPRTPHVILPPIVEEDLHLPDFRQNKYHPLPRPVQ